MGKPSLLEAIHANPSLAEANFMLAYINQLQASEYLLKGDLNRSGETLRAAEQYAEAARHGHEENSRIGNQLGFIYKQLAQEDLARNDRSSASDELEKAKALFQSGSRSESQ